MQRGGVEWNGSGGERGEGRVQRVRGVWETEKKCIETYFNTMHSIIEGIGIGINNKTLMLYVEKEKKTEKGGKQGTVFHKKRVCKIIQIPAVLSHLSKGR